ncbi:MFS transporter [Subtercola frigoramans]|uniref:EmrB/QacA subfamily drug resistance transporter n=1 Tax=Subtercola frigoramans TaxID=120298 RepID=A0ABS2L8Z0_9MICO|nr:MFS transporter [Subtercola frigoramans]MBM7473563.1 EmrB/QacA subfamily drug resistance transporter [Subtercola frigoramans]
MAAAGEDPGHPNRQRSVALLVAGTFFMENLDGTILTTAAPSIGVSLGVPSLAVGVTITAYLLTLAVLIPLSGWVTQRFGGRPVFITAIAVFTVASVLCALSQNLVELTVFRVLQGAGGAMMVPVGRLAVLRMTDKRDLVRTIALLTWPALAAPVIAPLVGGVLTTYASWHWIFLINVPLGLVAFIVALRILPNEQRARPPALDWVGLALTSIGLGVLVYLGSVLAGAGPGGSASGEAGSSVVELLALAILGIGLLAAAVWHLRRTAHPLLELAALRIETFRLAHAGGSVFRVTVNAVPFLLPLMFQDSFGYSPILAGTLVLFVFVGNIAIKPATTPLLRRFGFRTVIIAATIGAALSMVLSAFLTAQTPFALVIALMIFSGIMRSTGFTAYNTIAFADIAGPGMPAANTLASTTQQVAAGFGVAIAAVALRVGEAVVNSGAAASSAVGSAAGPASGVTSLVPLGAFQFSFLVIGLLTLLSTVEALRLTRSAGEGIRPVRLPA